MNYFKDGIYGLVYANWKYRFYAISIVFFILFAFSVYGIDEQNTHIYNIRMSSLEGKAPSMDKLQEPVNNPPQVLNLRIVDADTGQQFASGRPYTGDRLRAEYQFFDADGDFESSSTMIKWYKNGTQAAGEFFRNLSQAVKKGDRWYFTVTPHDGKSYGDVRASGEIIIQNAPPSVGYARILPISPSAKDDLTADYTYYDPDGDAESIPEIRWYKDGILQGFYNDAKRVPAYDGTRKVKNRGEKWKLTIRPRDADGAYGNMVTSPEVTIINMKPEVRIESITGAKDDDGDYTGDIIVRYTLVDEDGDRCKLSIYYLGGPAGSIPRAANVAEATNPSTDKHIILNVAPGIGMSLTWKSALSEPGVRAENFRIGIKPNDGVDDGLDGLSITFTLDNNKAPVASNLTISPASPFSRDDLTAEYTFTDEDGDKESGSEIKWYNNGTEQVSYRNVKLLPNGATKRGEEWYFTVRPKDGKEFGDLKQSSKVKISNSPPLASGVKLQPDNPTAGDDLKAVFNFEDMDGDPIASVQIRWYMQSPGTAESLQNIYNNKDVVPAADKVTAKNQIWYFTLQATDGITPSEIVKSNQVKIVNMVPVVRGLSVPAEAFRDVTLKFDLVDADNDKCNLKVEYKGGLASDWTLATIKEPLTGISPGLVTLTWESAKDQNIHSPAKFQVRIMTNDGTADGIPAESNFFTLDNNIPPVASNLRILPEKPTTSDNLSAEYVYTDPDGNKESGTEITWFKDGLPTINTGRILLASATGKGQAWSFTVKPRDGARFGEVSTSNPVIILNSPPLASAVTIKPAAPKAGDTLSVQYSYRDVDEDKESGTEVEWFRNGVSLLKKVVAIEADKSMSIPVSKGEKWNAVVRPRDGEDFGQPVSSPTVTVDNASPLAKDIKITGDSGDITVTYTLVDGDGDACDLDIQYQGGSAKTTWKTATIKEPIKKVTPGVNLILTWVSNTDEKGQRGSDYRIRITPSDGVNIGTLAISNTFTVNNNTIPTAVNISIQPDKPITSDELRAVYMFVDPDGDSEGKPEIRWYRSSLLEALYNDRNPLPASATVKGERWYYTIRVNDGKDYGKTQLSPAVTIYNAPPVASNVRLQPSAPKINEQLNASYNYSDADGDAERNTEIKWYRNNQPMALYDNSKLIPGNATKAGEEWYFTVKPSDGADSGVPVPSNKVFVSNELPMASSLRILPVDPLTTDDLVASYIYTDPEGDPESGSKIVWYKNSVVQTNYNDKLSVPSSATAKGQVWYFTVQPKDGKQFGGIVQSNNTIIKNTPPRVENLRLSPPYPLSKDDLAASYDYFDVDGDVEGRSEIKWYRDGLLAKEGLKTILSKDTITGQTWYFTVRPYDGADFGAIANSPTIEVGSPIPRANNLTITPQVPLTTDDLTAKYDYVDPNNISESGSQIKWFKNTVEQTEYGNRKILPSEATGKNQQWYFSVKPKNGSLFGPEQFSSPVTVINSPPKLNLVIPYPNNPTTDDKIEVDYIFDDPDKDQEAKNEIRWFKDGVLQSIYNNITEIPAEATKRGERWYFTIRTSDGTEFSELYTSAIVTIGNGRPKVDNMKILPAAPLTTDKLEVTYTYIDTEKDPESGTEAKWYKNDIQQVTYDNQVAVSASATNRGEKWHCVIRPKDGLDFGESYKSPVVTIGNTPPVTLDIAPLAGQVLRGASVLIAAQGQDVDSMDAEAALKCFIAYRFGGGSWVDMVTEYVEVPVPRWQAAFKPDVNAKLGDYDFRAKFADSAGGESSWKMVEKMVVVVNNPPIIDPSLDDLRIPEDTVKQFDLRPYGSDLENDKTLTWAMDVNSVNKELFQASITSNRFLEIKPADNKNGRDDITLTLTDLDGTVSIKSDVSIIIDPVNDPPGMPSVMRIVPNAPKTTDNLICEASGSVDADNDIVIYRYQWYKNGVAEPGLRSSNVSYSRTLKGELWRCEVIPSDGVSDGPMRFAEVTIGNTIPEISIRKVTNNTKDIQITFDLIDADNDNCDLKVEYKIKGGQWKPGTTTESIRGVKPGTGLVLTWRSGEDESGAATDDCRLRLTPNDGVETASAVESGAFLLDNKPPEFTLTAIPNPVHKHFIDITMVANEKLVETPKLSALLDNMEPVNLDVQSISGLVWISRLVLETGFSGTVNFVAEGKDMVGNIGKTELQKELEVPGPLPRPDEYGLFQNYPNPVDKANTNIPYQLKESSVVAIKIYSVTGELVRTLDEGYKVAGFYKEPGKAAKWDMKDDEGIMVGSGVYYYYMKVGGFEAVKKMAVRR